MKAGRPEKQVIPWLRVQYAAILHSQPWNVFIPYLIFLCKHNNNIHVYCHLIIILMQLSVMIIIMQAK